MLNVKWNKLVTRIISIRAKLLEEADINPEAELHGCWEPVYGSKKLSLHIKAT